MGYLLWVGALASLVFLGRFALVGLAPDAALYAGLAYKIHQTGEYWRLQASENFFPLFFEHPPYFFQWGSVLFDVGWVSDGGARLMGVLPSLLGLALLLLYFYRRNEAFWGGVTVLLLLASGHFTKYAATSLLEAPLFLGVVMVFIASVDLERSFRDWNFLLLGLLGAFVVTASKGVAGFGAALALIVLYLGQFGMRWNASRFAKLVLWGLCFLLPFGLWALATYSVDPEQWYFLRYIKEQVLRSATTNRDNLAHSLHGSRFYYLGVLLRSLPHLVLLSLGTALHLFIRAENYSDFEKKVLRACLVFFLCFFLPFSAVSFQLPHYLHPVYFCLALTATLLLKRAWRLPRYESVRKIFARREILVTLWLVLGVGAFFYVRSQRGITKAANRGQEFVELRSQVLERPDTSRLWVLRDQIDPYRMECFALWYFRGRSWSYLEDQNREKRPQQGDILWDRRSGLSVFGGPGL